MRYQSLNNATLERSFTQAMIEGLAPDRGLYFPAELPEISGLWSEGEELSIGELGARLLAPLCAPDLSEGQLTSLLSDALSFPIPLRQLDEQSYVLELFHGPTCAFKDVGARFLARALSALSHQRLTILVATSGDTGSAVAQGFVQVPNIDVVILYPQGRISHVQEQQLTTVGHNVTALEVKGSFDDCQRLVKSAFLDDDLRARRPLTSANSINIARWIPQSIYYAWAAYQLRRPITFSVPSGNVGNLAAGLLAVRRGVSDSRLIASTNANDGLTRHLLGEDFQPRPSTPTLSNAMDVGDPSNLPRLWALCDGDPELLRREISGYSVTDAQTLTGIREVYTQHQYLMCPHTAVGWRGWQGDLTTRRADNEGRVGVILGTAHPAKFSEVVEEATGVSPALPPQLSECLRREKQSVVIEASEAALKRYLLDTSA